MTKHSHNWRDRVPTWLLKFFINIWPPLLGAGIKVTKISANFRHIEVMMKLHWYNKNYKGTHFGGALFSMTDPFYALILIKNLGPNYIIWDKASFIDFKKASQGTLKATFRISEDELQSIKHHADQNGKYIFDKHVDILNEEGVVVSSVTKTLYVRRREKQSKNEKP